MAFPPFLEHMKTRTWINTLVFQHSCLYQGWQPPSATCPWQNLCSYSAFWSLVQNAFQKQAHWEWSDFQSIPPTFQPDSNVAKCVRISSIIFYNKHNQTHWKIKATLQWTLSGGYTFWSKLCRTYFLIDVHRIELHIFYETFFFLFFNIMISLLLLIIILLSLLLLLFETAVLTLWTTVTHLVLHSGLWPNALCKNPKH